MDFILDLFVSMGEIIFAYIGAFTLVILKKEKTIKSAIKNKLRACILIGFAFWIVLITLYIFC